MELGLMFCRNSAVAALSEARGRTRGGAQTSGMNERDESDKEPRYDDADGSP
jgi:hypothetical protein